MKHTLASLLALSLLALPVAALAQGQLAPPSAPVPSMKTLDQVEARTPLGVVGGSYYGISIDAPGSYLLMGNLTVSSGNAITITVSDVTLDLNGFTLRSTAGTPNGIAIQLPTGSSDSITIRNGHIKGDLSMGYDGATLGRGFMHGIYSSGSARSTLVSEVSVIGVSETAMLLDYTSTVDRCFVAECKFGIRAQVVSNSTAEACYNQGISGTTVSNCHGESYSGAGIGARVATNCYGHSNTQTGLYAECATNCYGRSYSGPAGLTVTGTASFCRGDRMDGVAIKAGIAVACTATYGTIIVTGSKQLGTP